MQHALCQIVWLSSTCKLPCPWLCAKTSAFLNVNYMYKHTSSPSHTLSLALVQAGHISSGKLSSPDSYSCWSESQPTSADGSADSLQHVCWQSSNKAPHLSCFSLPSPAASSASRSATRLHPSAPPFSYCVWFIQLRFVCHWWPLCSVPFGGLAAALPVSSFPCRHMEGQKGVISLS